MPGLANWEAYEEKWYGPHSISGTVWAIGQSHDGDLYIGGDFGVWANNHTVLAHNIAHWDGVDWHPLGDGVGDTVLAVAVLLDGSLVAGGTLTEASGTPVKCIARWDGEQWTDMGGGMTGHVNNTRVRALAVLPDGRLLAAGSFSAAGGVPARGLALWNGTEWSQLGPGLALGGSAGNTIAVLPNGDIVIGGSFNAVAGVAANNIARWTGSEWLAMGEGMDREVDALCVRPNGDLLAGGQFGAAGGEPAQHIACWNGAEWGAMGTGIGPYQVNAIVSLPGDHLYACGEFLDAGGLRVNNIAQWDGQQWTPLGNGIDRYGTLVAECATRISPTEVVVAGAFAYAGGIPASNIAAWTGDSWRALGAGIPGGGTYCLSRTGIGSFVIGGSFEQAGEVQVEHIAEWDGTQWRSLGSGLDDRVYAVLGTSSGAIVAGGWFLNAGATPANHLAVWDGETWHEIGGGTDDTVYALAEAADGSIFAGGTFANAGGVPANRIAQWDGAAWQPLAEGTDDYITDLLPLPDGDLIVSGKFTIAGSIVANGIARWDGNSWHPMGGGVAHDTDYPLVSAIALLPDGDIVAAGRFDHAGGVPVSNIARWDGASWSPINLGEDGDLSSNRVLDLATTGNGELLVVGGLWEAGGQPATSLALWREASAPRVLAEPPDTISRERARTSLELDWYGSRHVAFRWQRDGVPLTDGATSYGSILTGTSTDTLTIINTQHQDAGGYSCGLVNDCGTAMSRTAQITVSCAADFDLDGATDTRDFLAFLNAWANGDPLADWNDDGTVNTQDFLAYLNDWSAGC